MINRSMQYIFRRYITNIEMTWYRISVARIYIYAYFAFIV